MLHYTRLKSLARDKHSSLLGPCINYKENVVLWIQLLSLYSQHFIFFVTYEWALLAWVLYYISLKSIARDKHSSLLGPCIKYKENVVLWIQLHGQCSQHFIFFVTYKWAELAELLYYFNWLKILAMDKHSSLLDPFVSFKVN